MTVAETAQALGIDVATCYSRCADGSLPSIRLGKRILIPKVALEQFLSGLSGKEVGAR